MTRLDGAGRPLEGDVVHHLGVVGEDEVETRDGLRTLPAVRCALETPQFRLFGEFDGKIKYGKLLKPGQSPSEAVFEEKRREDEIREITDYGFVRFIWEDLDTPRRTLARVESRMRIAG